jgi:hypothetical protein
MQAIEVSVEIDQNHQIHVQLPKTVNAHKAKVIVMYEEETPIAATALKLGLFKGKIKISEDFDEPLPDSFWLEGKL